MRKAEAQALIGFMFDISERKKTEERLLSLQKELEVLSFKDGLTSIANRRCFDTSFEREWERTRSDGKPLSMLLFDVDFFKQYNDLYGHIRGDKCLVDIAQTCVWRWTDSVTWWRVTVARSLWCCCPKPMPKLRKKWPSAASA
jgi:predicted signal transduction protein with EAL and GGDEF domain